MICGSAVNKVELQYTPDLSPAPLLHYVGRGLTNPARQKHVNATSERVIAQCPRHLLERDDSLELAEVLRLEELGQQHGFQEHEDLQKQWESVVRGSQR